jgi:hypothetical protein
MYRYFGTHDTMRKVLGMSLPKKIALSWLGLLCIQFVCTFFTDIPIAFSSYINIAIQTLLTIIVGVLVLKEPTRRGKFIFINLFVFFLVGMSSFVGGYFGSPEFRYIFYIFSASIYYGALTFSIVYIACDTLFRDFSIIIKYLIAFAIVGGMFFYYSSPYIFNTHYLAQTQDYRDWSAINQVRQELTQETGRYPGIDEIAPRVQLQIWNNGKAIGQLYDQEKFRRVQEILPYVESNNYVSLLFRPLYYSIIYMNVFGALFILLFFGFQYKKDPPMGAYIEKIMLSFLILCTLEILHTWAYIYTLELGDWVEFFQIGVYISSGILVLLALFFSLRLKFIVSPTGKDYEQELVRDAKRTTRWRDVFDDLLIRRYFNPKALKGRLLALRGKDSTR